LYDASSGSNDGSDGDSEVSKSYDNEDESAYKSDSSDLDSELDYDSEMPVTFTKISFVNWPVVSLALELSKRLLDRLSPERSSTVDYDTVMYDIITTTETSEAQATTEFTTTSSTSTTTSTATTDLVTDQGTTQLSTITTDSVMPTFGDSENSDFRTEKSPETKSEFITEAPRIPAKWTDWVSFFIFDTKPLFNLRKMTATCVDVTA